MHTYTHTHTHTYIYKYCLNGMCSLCLAGCMCRVIITSVFLPRKFTLQHFTVSHIHQQKYRQAGVDQCISHPAHRVIDLSHIRLLTVSAVSPT